MKADVGFSLGFFCGALLGAVGVYLTVSPDGKKLRTQLVSEYKKHQSDLLVASVLPQDKKTSDKISKSALQIREWIKQIRAYSNSTPVKTIPTSSTSTPKRKHHFKKK